MLKLIYSFSLIILPLMLGYFFSKKTLQGRPASDRYEKIRSLVQRFVLLGLNPIIFVGAVWSLNLNDPRLMALPAVGIVALASGLGLGLIGMRFFHFKAAQKGVYASCASFTNIGNIGGLLVYILIGEAGFALVPFYKLFEDFWNFGVLFPIARTYGYAANPAREGNSALNDKKLKAKSAIGTGLARVFKDPFFIIAFLSVSLGIVLNIAGFIRPSSYGTLNTVLIPLGSFIFLFTIGMKMSFSNLGSYAPKAALLLTGKILIVPAIAFGFASLIGLGAYENGIALKTILILAAGPVGFLGLVPPNLYGLDTKLANALWIYSNAAMLITVPLLSFILSLM
ncbi:hypothetical protein MASR2M78_19370 [Treponema sp.]